MIFPPLNFVINTNEMLKEDVHNLLLTIKANVSSGYRVILASHQPDLYNTYKQICKELELPQYFIIQCYEGSNLLQQVSRRLGIGYAYLLDKTDHFNIEYLFFLKRLLEEGHKPIIIKCGSTLILDSVSLFTYNTHIFNIPEIEKFTYEYSSNF